MLLSKISRTLNSLLVSLAVLLSVSTVLALLWLTRSGYLLSVASSSMVPTFRSGDAVVVLIEPVSKLIPGEVVSYKSYANPKIVISHRLVNKTSDSLITRGDAESLNDDPVSSERVIGRVVAVLPKLGYLMDFIRNPLGLGLAVYAPALFVIYRQVKQLYTYYNQPHYKLASR